MKDSRLDILKMKRDFYKGYIETHADIVKSQIKLLNAEIKKLEK